MLGMTIPHGLPTTFFFILWSSYVCRIIRIFLACNEFLSIYNLTIFLLFPNSYIWCSSNILFQLRIKCTRYLLVVHPKNSNDIILSPDYLWLCDSAFFKYFLFFLHGYLHVGSELRWRVEWLVHVYWFNKVSWLVMNS